MSAAAVPQSVRRRLTATLFASESLFAAAMIASFTLLPIIAVELSGRDSAAGFPLTVQLLGQAAFAYPIGWLMDRIGRRSGLTIGYLLAALGGMLAAASIVWGSFLGFCLGAGMIGMGRGAGLQARFAAAEVQPTTQRAKAIGLIVFAGTIGAVGGPLLVGPSGRLALRFGFDAHIGPYAAAAVLFYLAMTASFLLLRPDPLLIGRAMDQAEDPSRDQTSGAQAGRSLRQIFARPSVRLATASMVVGQLVMTMIMVITPLYMNRFDYTNEQISLVIMAHTLGMFALSGLTGWLIDRVGRIAMIGAGAAVLALSAVLAPVAVGLVPLMVALFLLGLGWNFCFIGGSSLLSDALASHERGRAQGANDMLVALASGSGSFSTGVVFALGGITLIGGLGLGVALLLLAATIWFTRLGSPIAVGGD